MSRVLGWLMLTSLLSAPNWDTDFSLCRSGPGVPADPMCADLDADHDGDVDQSDFGAAQIHPYQDGSMVVYVIITDWSLEHSMDPNRFLARLFAKRAGLSQ